MTLSFAQACAARLVDWLRPHSERIEVAGSIRRRRPVIGDVDLVVIPIWDECRDLWGAVEHKRNLTLAEIERRAAGEHWQISRCGPDLLSFLAPIRTGHTQVDVFWADPDTWGTRLLCRTGSKEHNIWLAQLAQDAGGKWSPPHGLYLGGGRVSADEPSIYAALGLPVLDPVADREAPAFRRMRPVAPHPDASR